MPIDRRVARTRTALYDALVTLIRQRGYDAITVEDILREANIGRSTFYAHFRSKDDLLEHSLERLRALLLAALQPGQPRDPARALFEHVGEYADIPVALAGGRAGAILREAVDSVVAGVLRGSLPPRMKGPIPRELAISHIVATFNTVFHWWLEHPRAADAATATALFRRLLLEGLPAESCAPSSPPAEGLPAVLKVLQQKWAAPGRTAQLKKGDSPKAKR